MLAPPLSDDDLGGPWYPPAPRPPTPHPIRRAALVLLIVPLLGVAAIGVSHTVQLSGAQSAQPALRWAPSAASPSGVPPTAPPPWAAPAVSSLGAPPAGSIFSAPPAAWVPWASNRGPRPRAPRTVPQPSNSSGLPRTSLDLTALAAKVDPAVVDVNTVLSTPNEQAAGTGIVLDSSGVVLTNNHVISGATSITVTDIGTQQSYPATVIGYDRTHDIAVLQLRGASGLPTAEIGDSIATIVLAAGPPN